MYCKETMTLKFLMMLLTVCCFGCSGGGADIDLGAVSGVVTMDGSPLADAIVVFVPTEGNPSTGRTDANGNYELAHLGDSKGAVLGSHKVRIITGKPVTSDIDGDADITKSGNTGPADTAGSAIDGLKNPSAKGAKEPIPAKYNTKTELTADVKAGENTFDFKLDSK